MGCGSSTAKRRADGRWQEAKPNRLTAVEEEVEAMNEAECRRARAPRVGASPRVARVLALDAARTG